MAELPVAETFTSIQGEGVWAGTLMFFLRLAGCNVGKFLPESQIDDPVLKVLRKQHPHHAVCHTVDGQAFLCDTNYSVTRRMALEEVEQELRESGCLHMCITGGEPMLHAKTLIQWLNLGHVLGNVHVHFETSGTLPVPPALAFPYCKRWVACSPKRGFQKECQTFVREWKFVVGPDTDLATFSAWVAKTVGLRSGDTPIYIQPVNHVGEVDTAQLPRCLELLYRNPQWRLSVQLHKLLRLH